MILNIWVKYMKKDINKIQKIITILLFSIIIALGIYFDIGTENQTENTSNNTGISYEISNIPEYNGKLHIEINNNMPKFTAQDINLEQDYYSTLKDKKVRNGDAQDQLGKSK